MAVKNTRVSNMLRIAWIILPILLLLVLSRTNTHGVTLPFFCDPDSVFGALMCGGGFGQLLERNVYLKIVIKDIDYFGDLDNDNK